MTNDQLYTQLFCVAWAEALRATSTKPLSDAERRAYDAFERITGYKFPGWYGTLPQ